MIVPTVHRSSAVILADRFRLRGPRLRSDGVRILLALALLGTLTLLFLSARHAGARRAAVDPPGTHTRNGAHDKRKLTLYPPLSGTPLGDLGGTPPPRDMATHPPDMSTQPADMSTQPADMSTQPDMAAPPPDMAMTSDMTDPADMPAKID